VPKVPRVPRVLKVRSYDSFEVLPIDVKIESNSIAFITPLPLRGIPPEGGQIRLK